MKDSEFVFWSGEPNVPLERLESRETGLSYKDAKSRLRKMAPHLHKSHGPMRTAREFATQFKSPIILILLFAAGLSAALEDTTDATIILGIVFVSRFLGFWQEHNATHAVEGLLALVKVSASVLRDGREVEIQVEEVVPGDLVILNAGDVIPGDCLLLESKDLFVDEPALTGETFPVEKWPVFARQKRHLRSGTTLYSWVHMRLAATREHLLHLLVTRPNSERFLPVSLFAR